VKRAFFLQSAAVVLALVVVTVLARIFPVVDYITRAQQTIGEMEVWGGLLYPVLYGACNVLLLPAGVMAIGSGLFFGLWWGFLLNLAGNVGGAAVAFFISRKLGRNWVTARFLRHRKWAALDAAIGRHGWKIIFLSQVHPLFPTSLLNYLYGITRIRFGTCLLWIALGQAPGLFLYAYLGTLGQLGLRVWRGQNHPQWYEYVVWIGGLGLALAVTAALGRIAMRLVAEAKEIAEFEDRPPSAEASTDPVLEIAKS
jgi:uncharacterized membrane protein YdjX (TVP38/TMEM64 family)